MRSPGLLLVANNPDFLQSLVEMLEPKYEVIATLPSGNSTLDQISSINPNILLLDISLGDLSGLEVSRRLRDSNCAAKIIFLSMHENREFVSASLDVGASGYVFKSRAGHDLTDAIDCVFNGGCFFPPAE